ncbi:VCBS repeat-containing protein [bacterium]|nr:VCBS repeat-containing protein [bacterium]
MTLRVAKMLALALLLPVASCFGAIPTFLPGIDREDHEAPAVQRSAGGFLTPIHFTTDSPGLEISIADYDGDGKLDILVPLLGGSVAVLINQSTPGYLEFLSQVFDTSGKQVQGFSIGDLNEDSYPDLAFSFSDHTLELHLQQAGGGFELLHRLERIYTKGIAFDKVNSDDDVLDLLVADEEDGLLAALWFDSELDLFFGGPVIVDGRDNWPSETVFGQMVLADLDGNSLNDVVLIDELRDEVSVHLHIPDPLKPEFIIDPDTGEEIPAPPEAIYPRNTSSYGGSAFDMILGAEAMRIDVGDFDNDAVADIAVLTEFLDGDILAEPVVLVPPLPESNQDFPSHFVALYKSQLVTTGLNERVHRHFEFSFQIALSFPTWVKDVKVADIDNDGNLDVVGCGDSPSVHVLFIYPGLGGFTFDDPVYWGLPGPPLRLEVADLDGDGYLDVVVLLPFTNTIAVLLNDGDSGQGDPGTSMQFQYFPLQS